MGPPGAPIAPTVAWMPAIGGFADGLLRPLAAAVALLPACVMATPACAVEVAACLELERQFELANRHISSLQMNEILFRASSKGCAPLARRLLDAGASVNARDRDGTMPLGYAAQSGQAALVDLLLERGAPINARNLAGPTALYAAAEHDRATVVRQLLAKGADPNPPGRSGVSALVAAAFKGNKPIVDCCSKTAASRTRSTRPGRLRLSTPPPWVSRRSFNACSTPASTSTPGTATTSRS